MPKVTLNRKVTAVLRVIDFRYTANVSRETFRYGSEVVVRYKIMEVKSW